MNVDGQADRSKAGCFEGLYALLVIRLCTILLLSFTRHFSCRKLVRFLFPHHAPRSVVFPALSVMFVLFCVNILMYMCLSLS